MSTNNWTVQLVTDTTCRKICRVWFGSDGSYYVTAPYHKARSATVQIITAYYERRRSQMDRNSYVDVGLVEHDEKRLKLSHHPDGFVQFSGEGIVSGRSDDGKPKGIGIQSFPLSRPPLTGPSFGCTILGLEDFAVGDPQRSDAINFHDEVIPPLGNAGGFLLEGSYFTGSWREFVFMRDEKWFLDMRHPMGAIIRYRVLLDSGTTNGFIGLRMFRADVRLSDHPSGFILSGPSTNIRTVEGERMADGIHCVFPAMTDSDLSARVLKYVPSPSNSDSESTEIIRDDWEPII